MGCEMFLIMFTKGYIYLSDEIVVNNNKVNVSICTSTYVFINFIEYRFSYALVD